MRCFAIAIWLLLVAVLSLAADPPPVQTDEQALKDAGIATDGPGLVDFLRRRALQDGAADKINGLIRQLGDDDFEVREKACAALIDMRHRAVPFLLQARNGPQPEVARRAEMCLRQIGSGMGVGIETAAIRLLASRKPAGAVETLLVLLNVAETDALAEEVTDALASILRREGRPDKAVVAALGDKLPLRRAVAAVALCRAGMLAQEPAIRKAMQDADLSVRLRAALALATVGEKAAIPVLIDLLTKAPMEGAWEAEDCLLRLTDGPGPGVPFKPNADSRKKCRDAWARWWEANEGKADLKKLKPVPPSGVTLVVLLDESKVREIDAAGKTLWEVKELGFPLDAQVVPDDRVLVAEHQNNVVTERDRTGKVLWKKVLPVGPIAAHRLPDGNIFIATAAQMMEVNRAGDEVRQYLVPQEGSLRKAERLRNGDVGCVTGGNRFVRLDREGKELVSFLVDVATSGGRIEVLANGHVLVPQMNQNKVIEYNSEGKPVWEVTINQPIAAVRLPNGHTLVTTVDQHRAVELERGGRIVWDYRGNTRVTRAFRR